MLTSFCSCFLVSAVKHALIPGAKGVQVLAAAQINKLKEAGGNFRSVTSQSKLHKCCIKCSTDSQFSGDPEV